MLDIFIYHFECYLCVCASRGIRLTLNDHLRVGIEFGWPHFQS